MLGALCSIASGSGTPEDGTEIPRGGIARVIYEVEQVETVDSEQLLDALVVSGPLALTRLFDLLEGRSVGDIEPLETKLRRQVQDSLTEIPRWLRTRKTTDVSPRRRETETRIGLEILGRFGSAQDIPMILAYFTPGPNTQPLSVSLTATAERTLTSLLERDRRAIDVLSSQFPALSLGPKQTVLRAVGSYPSEDSLSFLLAELDRESELTTVLLGQVGRVIEVSGIELDDYRLHFIQRELISQDSAVLRETCQALGRIGNIEPIGDLILLLEHEDPVIVSTAHWALERITDVRLPAERGRWQRWWIAEKTWWESEAPDLLRVISERRPATAGGALRALSSHRLYRHEIAKQIVPLLHDTNSGIVSQACAVLQVLRSHVAVEPLRRLIEQGESPSLVHAQQALKACLRLSTTR